MQGTAGIREVCSQVWELYMSTMHDVTERVRSGLPLSSLTFCRQTGTCRARLVSSRTFGPSPPCLFLCPRHLEETDDASLCSAAGSTPACTRNDHAAPQHAGSPHAPHHLRAGGLRISELTGLAPPCRALGARSSWNYITPCVIKSILCFAL